MVNRLTHQADKQYTCDVIVLYVRHVQGGLTVVHAQTATRLLHVKQQHMCRSSAISHASMCNAALQRRGALYCRARHKRRAKTCWALFFQQVQDNIGMPIVAVRRWLLLLVWYKLALNTMQLCFESVVLLLTPLKVKNANMLACLHPPGLLHCATTAESVKVH